MAAFYRPAYSGIWLTMLASIAGSVALVSGDDAGTTLTARQLYYSRPKAVTKTAVKKSSTAAPGSKDTPMPTATDSSTEAPKADAPNLGLRWSLVDEKTFQEIDPARVFHSGEKFRLKLQANSAGYLYVINKGSLQDVEMIFPKGAQARNNRIEPGKASLVPMETNFMFDADPGTETLFVVLSREREPDLDRLIEDVTREQSRPQGANVVARNNVTTSDLDRFRGKLASRGIRQEIVRTSEGEKENAAYVANVDYRDSRLVTEVVLRHE